MSLNQLPESSSSPRRSILPRTLVMALALALAACDKPQTSTPSPTIPSPVKIPTGAITNTLLETSPALRLDLVQRVREETLGATGQDFYTRGFVRDNSNLSVDHVDQLDVGFGPQGGTHVVTFSQEGGKTHRKDLLDADNDGDVDIVESSVSWPIRQTDTSFPLTHIEKDYQISDATHDAFATALNHALTVLAAEKKAKAKKE